MDDHNVRGIISVVATTILVAFLGGSIYIQDASLARKTETLATVTKERDALRKELKKVKREKYHYFYLAGRERGRKEWFKQAYFDKCVELEEKEALTIEQAKEILQKAKKVTDLQQELTDEILKEDTTQSNSRSPTGNWHSCLASTYGIGDGFLGKTTASGEPLNSTDMTFAARPGYLIGMGQKIEVEYKGKSCIGVRNDSGPFVGKRKIDLGPAMTRHLGFSGVHTIRWRFVK